MKIGSKNYSIPVLRTGKKITSVPKGSTKAKEQAKNDWYVEFYYLNPSTGKEKRERRTGSINRFKDPDTKLIAAQALVDEYTELLNNGWNPYGDNEEFKKRMIAITLKEAKEEFLSYHRQKNSRHRTLTSFGSKVKLMISYLGEDKLVTDITTIDITNTMLYLEKKNKWSGKTFENSKSALVNFFNFLKRTGRIKISPFNDFTEKRKILKSTRHPLFLEEDFDAILNWLQKNDLYTFFSLNAIYYTCLRPSELRLLKIKFVDIKDCKLTVPAEISKNKTTETISLDKKFVEELKEIKIDNYPPEFYLTGSIELIVGQSPQSEKMLYKRFIKCLKALKLNNKDYTLYSAKHLSNVLKRRAGWTLEEIQLANRHKSLAQTEIYLRELMKDVPLSKDVPSINSKNRKGINSDT